MCGVVNGSVAPGNGSLGHSGAERAESRRTSETERRGPIARTARDGRREAR